MTLHPPPQHARRENNFYKTQADLAAGLLTGLRRVGLALPAPLHDPCAGDAALLDGLGLVGSDLFPAAYPSDARLLLAPVDARDRHALARVLNDARALVSNRLSDATLSQSPRAWSSWSMPAVSRWPRCSCQPCGRPRAARGAWR